MFVTRNKKKNILLHHGSFLGLQDVVGEDPGHGHIDGELDSATHCELQEELPEPKLGEVTTLLQGLCMEEKRGSPLKRLHLRHSKDSREPRGFKLPSRTYH